MRRQWAGDRPDRRDEVLRSAGAVRFFFTRRAVRARTRAILLSAALVAFGGGAAAQDFERAVHPAPPDYADAESWAVRETPTDGLAADARWEKRHVGRQWGKTGHLRW